MSVVGPRPHAVAHNEQYRKLIKGTMLRHKVKPGITGWAQVNGLRGETETLDKMRARIQYDIDTMRNGPLGSPHDHRQDPCRRLARSERLLRNKIQDSGCKARGCRQAAFLAT